MSEPIDIEAIRKELAWVEMPESRKAIDTLLAAVERKGMRLFTITTENIKLRAEVERLTR